jgi:hypothetical protein
MIWFPLSRGPRTVGHRATSAPRYARPSLETLEDRATPAVTALQAAGPIPQTTPIPTALIVQTTVSPTVSLLATQPTAGSFTNAGFSSTAALLAQNLSLGPIASQSLGLNLGLVDVSPALAVSNPGSPISANAADAINNYGNLGTGTGPGSTGTGLQNSTNVTGFNTVELHGNPLQAVSATGDRSILPPLYG